jgi:hypothetical protein
MMDKNALESLTVSKLLEIAKTKDIKGRHHMKKAELIDAIVNSEVRGVEMNVVIIDESTVMTKDIEKDLVSSVEWDIELDNKKQEPQREVRQKYTYVDSAKIGMLIAFKVNDTKVLSGMIDEIHKHEFVVTTRNGIRFTIRKNNVIWVKTGTRWPKGVYQALRGETTSGYKSISEKHEDNREGN